MGVWLVTGDVHAGKTGFMEKFVRLCQQERIRAGGFLVKGEFIDHRRDRLKLVSVATPESIDMAGRSPEPGWISFKGYFFNPEAFHLGGKILRDAISNGSQVLVLDEVGPMEMQGGGWRDVLDDLAIIREIATIWVVRESLLKWVQESWDIPEERVFSISGDSPELLLRSILSE